MSCTAAETNEEASPLMSLHLTIHNRFPLLPLHMNLDDVMVISSDC
jgi:hypothetical protein